MKKQLLLFLFALLPMLAMADASGWCGTNVTYTFDSSTGTLTIQGSGAMTNYYPYSDAPWYSYENDIKTVIIEEGVTSIGAWAFYRCSSLTSVTIGNSVTSIGERAFSYCSGLTSVTIPNSVTSIGEWAFSDCSSLPSVTIGNSVTSIGSGAFSNCSGLQKVVVPNIAAWCGINFGNYESNPLYYAHHIYSDENTEIKELVIPDGVTSIGSRAFYGCSGLTSVTIGNGVTSIGQYAFRNCSGLASVTIPNSVTSIGDDAFYQCTGLTSVTIPNSVTTIGQEAFSRCSGLTSVTIGNSVTSIGSYAFFRCSGLTSVTIPNSVTSIEWNAFSDCSGLSSVTIGNGVTSIRGEAFSGCSGLTSITIPNSVTSIGSGAFSDCSGLTSITVAQGNTKYDSRDNCNAIIESASNKLIAGCTTTIIPNSVTSIGGYAFYGCSGLTSVTIPNSVTSIGDDAFYQCTGLTSVTIPNSVTSIGSSAFERCSGLTSVTIGNSVTSIGERAFHYCSGLTSVISKIETPFAFGLSAFNNIPNTCVLTVPYGTRDAYIAAGWTTSVFRGGVVEIDNVVIAMETGSGADRTMIGYSSQYSLDFTGINDVRAYIAIGFTDTKNVLMARVYVVPANTGIVLKSDIAGVEVEVPITTSDVYYANLLKPAVNNVTIYPTETIDEVNYTNLMVGKLANDEMGFVTLPSSNTYSNKCYLQVPTAFYDSATLARDGGMEIVFVDDETTDIRSLMHNGSATNDAYYDLQGRKVIPGKKGIYIHNGKKVIVR